MTRYVIDASAALHLASSGRTLATTVSFAAPRLLASETTSVLHDALWRGELSENVAEEHRRRLRDLPISLDDDPAILDRAWELANELGWARTYDAEYVALAQLLTLPLLTIDLRMARRLTGVIAVATLEDLA